jgi:hypothetical protein
VNGGRNYNGPKVRFASLSKIWLFAGKSEYPTLRNIESGAQHHASSRRCRVKMRWVQTISRKDQRERVESRKPQTQGLKPRFCCFLCGIANAMPFQRKKPAEILRDCTPDSNANWKRYSPNCMATCRGWQKCPLRFSIIDASKKPSLSGVNPRSRVGPRARWERRCNRIERNSLSGKFRPARMA